MIAPACENCTDACPHLILTDSLRRHLKAHLDTPCAEKGLAALFCCLRGGEERQRPPARLMSTHRKRPHAHRQEADPRPARTMPCPRRRVPFIVVTAMLGLAVLAVVFYGMSWLLPEHFCRRRLGRDEFVAYLSSSHIDWVVGWRPGPEDLAPAGFRRSPAGANLITPCVSLYGDSATFGHSVSPEAAWGNVLTTLLGCRVDN
jgi:hypothetical protein